VKTSPLAALDKAEELIVHYLGSDILDVRETLRAIRDARAEILRQATSREALARARDPGSADFEMWP
jgi:hypothetical protein